MKKEVINFLDFIADDNEVYDKLDKQEIMDNFFIKEDVGQENTIDVNEEEPIKYLEEPIKEIPSIQEEEEEEEEEKEDIEEYEDEIAHTKKPIQMTENNNYKIFKDKSEMFSCEITLEGANYKETQVRLILESDDWNIMFNGEIDKNGKCNIPIKKMNILEEGTVGKIKLEVIAEDSVFVPWEDDFEVKLSKKVSVKINETKSNPKIPNNKSGVSVKIKK